MDETMPDASPLSQRFLASLANFMESEHEILGEGDISSQVKVAIAPQVGAGTAESITGPDTVPAPSDHSARGTKDSNSKMA